ncbi:Receptor-like kinase [Arachis hypogaea]|nr:Receptor-like kinase [Arachis hypogaea]
MANWLGILIPFLLIISTGRSSSEQCKVASCSMDGPSIRFPFRLKGTQPEWCSHDSSFDLSCTDTNNTMLQLPFSFKALVKSINYSSQLITPSYPQGCSIHTHIPLYSLALVSAAVYHCLVLCLTGTLILFLIGSNRIAKTAKVRGNESNHRLECIGLPHSTKGLHRGKKLAGEILGPFMFLFVGVAAYCVYVAGNERLSYMKIKKLLEDYKALKPARYSYADIRRITNQFSEELGQGAYEPVFKGKLGDEIEVAVKVLNASSADTKDAFLGWEKLQDIALGIAKGIEYLHQGSLPKDQSIVSMTTARGTLGYIAPEVFSRNFGNVSCKSDVYSYGMLLLEMVGGRKITDVTEENSSHVYYPQWIYNLLDNKEDIKIHMEGKEDTRVAKKLSVVGLWCIQWHQANRPTMKDVVQMLERNGEGLEMPPNPFASTTTIKTRARLCNGSLNQELDVISEIE